MWDGRFAILRMMRSTDSDLPHGGQRLLAERFGAHKAAVSLGVKWVQTTVLPAAAFRLAGAPLGAALSPSNGST